MIAAVVFPFDLFGSPGAGAGATLLADELREMLADNKRETALTRAAAYSPQVKIREASFSTLDDYSDWRATGRKLARAVLSRGDFLLWLAGNHLGALPVHDELGEDALVVQLDAHLDIHAFRDTREELSHGNFLLHTEGKASVVNVGHRDLLLVPDQVAKHYRTTISAAQLAADPAGALERLRGIVSSGRRVFLDLDCDVFDPSWFPAVGTPVPFGLMPGQVLALLDAVGPKRLAGMLVSEFDPARDEKDRSLSALAWLVEHLLLTRCEP
ncbi:MAG: arginase family protein [Gemmataceae bacterium]|nr:arginase family protein [Gemmataceae bacterium]